jgi:hypothetical protein
MHAARNKSEIRIISAETMAKAMNAMIRATTAKQNRITGVE